MGEVTKTQGRSPSFFDSFIKEAKPWCPLHNPLLVRALLGMKGGVLLDLQVADLVVCTDVDGISQKRDHQRVLNISFTLETHIQAQRNCRGKRKPMASIY